MSIPRSALLLSLLALPTLGRVETIRPDSPQAFHASLRRQAAAPDTTCPPYREESERILKRFLSSPGVRAALPSYGITPADTSEVVPVTDVAVCAALDSTLARVLADSILYYDPQQNYRSYFASDSLYYAVEKAKPLDSLGVDLTPPPGTEGYLDLAMNGIVVFGRDFSFKQGFPY
jgi:hypothetical protein